VVIFLTLLYYIILVAENHGFVGTGRSGYFRSVLENVQKFFQKKIHGADLISPHHTPTKVKNGDFRVKMGLLQKFLQPEIRFAGTAWPKKFRSAPQNLKRFAKKFMVVTSFLDTTTTQR